MKINENENKFLLSESEYYKKQHFIGNIFGIIGYTICLFVALIGKLLSIAEYTYTEILILTFISSSISIINVILGFKIIKFDKQLSRKLLFINYSINIIFFVFGIFFYQSIRVLMLFLAFLATMVFLPNMKIKFSIMQIFLTSVIYFIITFYSIIYLNQNGNIKTELLYVTTYIFNSIFYIIIGAYTKKLKDKIKNDKNIIEKHAEKLKELDKVKTNFFANISHEIRTPLTLILSPIESALQGDYKKELNSDFLKNIQRNALRLLKLINNLLDFSKLEAGRMKVHVQEFDLVQFMKNYISSVQSAFDTKKINISFMSFNNEVKIYLDLEKMDKIIMNLFSNALKFTERGGEIKIRIKDDEQYCYIEYEDNGIGIPSDMLHKIFDRFSQADSSSTRKYEGTGIGLALAKELIEMHKGEIKVLSKFKGESPDNHGTTFTVTFHKGIKHFEGDDKVEVITSTELDDSVSDHRFLGLRELEDQKEAEVTYEQVDCNDKSLVNLLIVEDNSDMRNFIKMLLEDKYCIHTAENGEEGLNKTREIKPDLIISDVMMPIMNGYEMTQKIKEDDALKLIPVLMLTAKAEIANKIEGLEYGADDYLTKPFNSKELLTRIKSLLKLKEMQNQLLDLNKNLAGKVEEQLNLIMKGDELKRYLPPQLVDSIIKGEKQVTFETERKKLTIFFSDIKGFTETTDGMEPEELSALLNEYLTEMTMIAHTWGGTIDKFIGDAIMIFYGAPVASNDKDHALQCVKMAIAMQIKMNDLKNRWYKSGIEYPLSIRIGINTGVATVGNFGAEERLSYTAIGGQVNLASRLEGLAEPGGILISHSTWGLVNDEIKCRQRDEKIKVKGISREIIVYDVM